MKQSLLADMEQLQKPIRVSPPRSIRRRGDVEFITWEDGLVTRHEQVNEWVEKAPKKKKAP